MVDTKPETDHEYFTVRVFSNLGNIERFHIPVQDISTPFHSFVPCTERNLLLLKVA